MTRLRTAAALATSLVVASVAVAQEAPSLAVARLEPLGLDPRRAAPLEALFRIEIERLARAPLAPLSRIDRELTTDPKLRLCTASPECLGALGAKLGVSQVVAGTIGELGTSYVIDVKLVDVATRKELRRVSTPLEGTPDDLIEAVRVAAHQLISPETVRGDLQVLADTPGATVRVDGRPVGTTPLAKPIVGLTLGAHDVIVEKPGTRVVRQLVEVRFQKTTQLVVGLVDVEPAHLPLVASSSERGTPAWRWVALGVAGVALGVGIGLLLRRSDDTVTCAEEPQACMPR